MRFFQNLLDVVFKGTAIPLTSMGKTSFPSPWVVHPANVPRGHCSNVSLRITQMFNCSGRALKVNTVRTIPHNKMARWRCRADLKRVCI